jgi:alkanesulfonate monooxygenase SsuD/methylene tetrahydromethanopterin reductase-like flavin-dependent oxidoreductase (luciferase family)
LVERYREAVRVVDQLLRNDTTSYQGTFYQLKEAIMRPHSVQQPRPPLVLAAHKPKMLRIVAEYADTWNSFGTVDEMRARNAILDDHCQELGRDPHTIVRSLYGWATMMPADPWESVGAFQDMVGSYAQAGVNEFLIDQPRPEQEAVLERVAAEVLPSLRAI